MSPLLSQIIRLTKSIYLREPSTWRPSAQFLAGKPSPFGFSGGIGIQWWYGADTFKALNAVVDLTIKHSPEFRNCDHDSVSDVVTDTLQEICINKNIFDGDAVVFSRFQTLFECRSRKVLDFSSAIRDRILENLKARIGRWCTIHAIPRLQPKSFHIEDESICVIARNDHNAWQDLISKGYQFDGWSPENPYLGLNKSHTFSLPGAFECLLVVEADGTQKGSRFTSILEFRKLAALMLATSSIRTNRLFNKSMADPYSFCIQFPHNTGSNSVITRSDCDPILPYYISDIIIDDTDVLRIKNWYKNYHKCTEEIRSRIGKGVHFLNRGINSIDIESFINYFITLDALFGERGFVESSIFEGLKRIRISDDYLKKSSWLFDLRNELVHGGSRYIAEWPKYTKYTQHFGSNPMEDVQILAQLAVLLAPVALAE